MRPRGRGWARSPHGIWRASPTSPARIGVRDEVAWGHVPPPQKKLIKTRKNENSSKLRTAICRGVFGNGGGVGGRLVQSTVVGQDCSYREQKSLLSAQKTARRLIYRGLEFLDMGRVRGVVLSVSCRAKSLHLSGMKDDFVWAVTIESACCLCAWKTRFR